jgi:hypothetical protein
VLHLVPLAEELMARGVEVVHGTNIVGRRVELPDLPTDVPIGGAQPRVAAPVASAILSRHIA